MSLLHVKGDATNPQGDGPKILAHCCNDLGRFSAGFALSVATKWPQVKDAYLAWYRSERSTPGEVTGRMRLGESQLVKIDEDFWVANIVGQHGIGVQGSGRPPIRYDALRKGLSAVQRWAHIHRATVHMPKLGSGLAGGHWGNIEAIVSAEVVNRGTPVVVYSLK